MKKSFKYKITLLTILYIILLFADYKYHSFLAETSFRNYEWLAYFRYKPTLEFIYSCDVIIGTIVFGIILTTSIIKKTMKNYIFIFFPIICVLLHELTLNYR